MLDRVLGCQHPERFGKSDRFVADGDLSLLHRLEQRALDLGGCPIDLVGKENAGHDRAWAHVERAGGGSVDLGTGQVSRQEVRCELDSAERQIKGLRQGADGPGLGEPGHALDQDVAAGQERDDQAFQERSLADDQLFHALDQLGQACPCCGDGLRSRLGWIGKVRGNINGWVGKLKRCVDRTHDFSARRRSISRRRMSPAASEVSLNDGCLAALPVPPPLA